MEITTNGKKLYESMKTATKMLQKANLIVEKGKIHIIGMDLSGAFLYRCSQDCQGEGEWSGALMANQLTALLKGCNEETTLRLDSVITVFKGKRKSSLPVEDVDVNMSSHIHRTFSHTVDVPHLKAEEVKAFLSEVASLTSDDGLSILFTAKDDSLILSVNDNGTQITESFTGATGEAVSRYGLNYLSKVFDKGDICLKFGTDAPLIIEVEDTTMVIAPRRVND